MGSKRCNVLKSAMCSTYNRLVTIIQCHDEFFLWQEYLDDRLLPDVTSRASWNLAFDIYIL